jgi:hypothetical protein
MALRQLVEAASFFALTETFISCTTQKNKTSIIQMNY